MPIKLNGTTFNNGGSCTFNGSTVKEIKFGTTTVWKAETVLWSGSAYASGYTPTYTNGYSKGTDYGDFYVQTGYGSFNNYKTWCSVVVPFNASNFSSITINWTDYCKMYSIDKIGVFSAVPTSSSNSLLYTCRATDGNVDDSSAQSGSNTFDISSRTGTLYVGIYMYNSQDRHNPPKATITKVTLT